MFVLDNFLVDLSLLSGLTAASAAACLFCSCASEPLFCCVTDPLRLASCAYSALSMS